MLQILLGYRSLCGGFGFARAVMLVFIEFVNLDSENLNKLFRIVISVACSRVRSYRSERYDVIRVGLGTKEPTGHIL